MLFAQHFIALFIESAPWLLLGLFIAGIMHELVPVDILQKHMGGNNLSSIAKAAVIGAPLPLCSCGVIPAALGLRRSGASKSSTISFLVATPETGVDSVSVSYALLGPVFAIVRPIAAITSAVYAGILVKILGVEERSVPAEQLDDPAKSDACCSTKKPSCCASQSASVKPSPSMFDKSKKILTFASGKLLADITFWLMLGLSMAALIQTFVPTSFLTQWGDGFIAMLVMAFIGIPMYVCATASTPIALGFLIAGLSPGAVLVFMLAGPATNVSTMGMIAKEMGKRTLGLYLFAVVSAAISMGYALNYMFSVMQWAIPTAASNAHEHSSAEWLYYISAVTLAALMLRNTVNKYFAATNAVTRSSHS
jgi:uncharacterized membrane protein YraQ (UPF0718 family)